MPDVEEQQSLTEADFREQENVPSNNSGTQEAPVRPSPVKTISVLKRMTNSVKGAAGAIVLGLRYENLQEEGVAKSPFEDENDGSVNPVDSAQLAQLHWASNNLMARDRQLQAGVEKYKTKSKLANLQSAAEVCLGKMPQELEEIVREVPEIGVAAMSKVLVEGKQPLAAFELRAAAGSLSSLHQTTMSSGQSADHLAGFPYENEGRPLPTLLEATAPGRPPLIPMHGSRSKAAGGMSTNSRAMLSKLASSNDRWARTAAVMLNLLEANADQLKKEDKGKDSKDGLDALYGLGISPSLLDDVRRMKDGANNYSGDNVRPFYEDINVDESRDVGLVDKFKKEVRIDFIALVVFILYLAAFVFYLFFRILYTLDGLGKYLGYGIAILCIEGLGGLSILPYAFTFIWKVSNTKPKPPPARDNSERDVTEWLLSDGTTLQYHIRVMIPCYKEPTSVVGKTILAALCAALPAGCKRTVYLCDDGKDPEKKEFCHALERSDVVYVSGRKRLAGEINGKSGNINSATARIYSCLEGMEIPLSEVIALFDADQRCSPDFFLKTVPLLDGGKDVGMVLTPQFFDNLDDSADIFNHKNVPFWHYTQVGYDALGVISCTGTNFLVRAKAFRGVGGFPDYTLTEDFALGIKLKENKWQCRYVEQYLAVGESPDGVRNCFQQRSRWAKGHFQLFFGKHCPLIFGRLPFFYRFMYTTVIVNYFSAFISTPVLSIVPMITIWIGAFPIIVNWQAATAVTVYYTATTMVVFYARNFDHLKSIWFSLVANSILWFAYLKAMFRGIFGRVSFKVTAKGLQKLAASGLQDAWVHVVMYGALLASFVVGIIQMAKGRIDSPLIISMLWIVYNSIPSFLLLYYWTVHNFISARFLRYLCSLCSLAGTAIGIASIVLLWPLLPNNYIYSEPATLTASFPGSQFSGSTGGDSFTQAYPAVNWRQDSQLMHKEVYLLNTSAAGNLTNYLLLGGYWETPLDVSETLDDIQLVMSEQQTGVAALEAASQAMKDQIGAALQTVGDTLGSNNTRKGIAASLLEMANQTNAVAISAQNLTTQLQDFAGDVVRSTEEQDAAERRTKPLTVLERQQQIKAVQQLTEKLNKYAENLADQVKALNEQNSTLQAAITQVKSLPEGGFIDSREKNQTLIRTLRRQNDELRQGLNSIASTVSSVNAEYRGMSTELLAMTQQLQSLRQSAADVTLARGVEYTIRMEDFVNKAIFEPSFWRNNSTGVDLTISNTTYDLEGGFITNMGAASLKATTPIAFSTAMAAWTMISFPSKVANMKGVEASLDYTVRHGADYLRKVLITGQARDGSNFTGIVTRVGFVQEEMTFWQRPEDTDVEQGEGRPAFMVLQEDGASDLAGLVAGALAASAVVFQTKDPKYSQDLISSAKEAMRFGSTTMASMTQTDIDLAVLYNSTSYFDDLAWGSAWLYRATGDVEWMENFMKFSALHLDFEKESADEFVFDWDHTFWAANSVMALAPSPSGTNLGPLTGFVDNAKLFTERWMCPERNGITPVAKSSVKGLVLHPNYTMLGVTANAAFLSIQLAQKDGMGQDSKEHYDCWALAQIRYMIGDADHSFLTGYGDDNPSEYAQDPAAACSAANIPLDKLFLCNTYSSLFSDHKIAAPGALVTGPLLDEDGQVSDDFVDRRPYNSSRVGIENNMGFMGALIGISQMTNADWQLCQQRSGAIRLDPVCGVRFVI